MATQEQKKIWIVGTVEKLGNFGFVDSLSLLLDEYGMEIYWEVDEIRDILFESDDELKIYIYDLYNKDLGWDDLEDLYDIIVTFRDNRNKVFTHGMNHIMSVK